MGFLFFGSRGFVFLGLLSCLLQHSTFASAAKLRILWKARTSISNVFIRDLR